MRLTKSIFIVVMLCITASMNAEAQIAKGINVLSGSILFTTNKSTTTDTQAENNFSSLGIMPRFGHFFGEKTEAGISVGYNWTKNENIYNDLGYYSNESTSGLFFVGPYIRFYQNLAERFYFNFSVTTAYSIGGSEQINSYQSNTVKTEYDITEFQAGVGPGLTYFFNNHWSTNFSLGILSYDTHSSTNKDTDKKTTTNDLAFGINAGSLAFGIGLYF